jgi:hypothetical protein
MIRRSLSRVEAFENDICELRLHKVQQVGILRDSSLGTGLHDTNVMDATWGYFGDFSVHQGPKQSGSHLGRFKSIIGICKNW